MEASISKVVHDAGQKLGSSIDNFADALNQTLNQLLGWPFRASAGFINDQEGYKTDMFGSLIYAVSESQPEKEPLDVNADNVACVIEVVEIMDMERFRTAYQRIAAVKRLKKTMTPNVPDVPHTNVTLGIVILRDAKKSIKALAEELDRLNQQHSSREWTDMVVVFNKATINYAVQFPGENVTGDFLPPAEGAPSRKSPPIYVVIVSKPTELFTFNKMFSFLIAHLMIFSPGAKLPNWYEVLEGSPEKGITGSGYQFNLSGSLMPVPRKFYNDRYIPPRPFLIEDQQGNLLSTLKFLPWQDGGVILLRGKLPLEGLLIFLGKNVLERGGIVKRDDCQISYVLPITQSDFMKMLQRIETQSNMVVKLDPTKFVVQKLADEGTSSPFIARLHLGILCLRDAVFPDSSERDIFDKPYQLVLETIMNVRSTSQKIQQLVADHLSGLKNGKIGQIIGISINIEKPIDKELRKELETFLNSSVRVLKQGMQDVAKTLQFNIGFLFKKQRAFENGIQLLKKDDPYLAAYLEATREWSEILINCRNAMEHEGWILPTINYREVMGTICADEPKISDRTVSEFLKYVEDRLICFVEEVTAHCLKLRMPIGISVTEILLSQRKSDIQERFEVTLRDGGMPIWNIAYHQTSFEET